MAAKKETQVLNATDRSLTGDESQSPRAVYQKPLETTPSVLADLEITAKSKPLGQTLEEGHFLHLTIANI